MDFSTPQKLAPIALLRVFSRVLRAILSQFWPILIVYFFQVSRPKEDSNQEYFLIFIYIALGLTVLNGIIRYLTYRWSIEGDALVIRHGVIRKVDLRIPFERIQAIDLQQPWYYRLANTVRFVVDTAGSGGKEAEIWALQVDAARRLREFILERKEEEEEVHESAGPSTNPTSRTWVEVDVLTLFKIGLFRNHFRSIAAFIGGAFYLYSQIQDVIEAQKLNEEIITVYDYIPKVFSIFVVLGFLVMIAAILFSIILTIVRFYGFKVVERRDALEAKYGLASVKTRQLKPSKIQIMKTEQGPVFKWLGIIRFKIEQAYAQKVRNKEDFTIPGSPYHMVQALRTRLFGVLPEVLHPGTSKKWIVFRSTRLGMIPLIIPAVIIYFTDDWNFSWMGLWLPFQVVYSILLWRFQGLGIDGETLITRKKVIFEKLATLQLDKVQAVTMKRSFYQRRKGLCSLSIETAGGSVDLPFLPEATAQQLTDYLLYRSETSKLDWM